jgi:hypothetical protein
MKSFSNKMKFAGLALVATSTLALAAVTFDSGSGTGFVGKGDVQLALGLNNAQLQAQADSLVFAYTDSVVTEVSWECTKDGVNTQERERTTTTTTQGIVTGVARVRNQITGFNMMGYTDGAATSTTTDGPPLNSCPNPNSTYLMTPAGEPVEVSSTGGLTVNGVALQ